MGCEHYNSRNNNLILYSIPDCIKDVVILVDRSENVLSGNGLSNWRTLQEFLMRFIAALDVGPSRTRIGIVSFNEASRPELRFSQCSNDQCVKNTIFAIDAPVSVLKISIITTVAIKIIQTFINILFNFLCVTETHVIVMTNTPGWL